jgi:hypothetical protein
MAFSQLMTERWTFKFPGFDIRMMQTRSSVMRVSLQLWDTETGALQWNTQAETTLQSESFSQDPVYFDDAARVTFGSLIADLLNGKTVSTYSPLNQLIDQLIQQPGQKNGENVEVPPAAPASKP